MSRLLPSIRVVLLLLSAVSIARATAPSISVGASTASYTENGSAVQIDDNNTITISGGTGIIVSATVNISSTFLPGDQLNFVDQNGISGSYDSGTGILTLSSIGNPSAEYQDALRSITFSSTSDDPTDLLSGVAKTSRQINWRVTDDAAFPSSVVHSTIAVSAVNDVPTISNVPATMTIVEDTQSTFNAGGHEFLDVVFADVDSPSVTVTVAMTLTSGGTPTGSFDLASGTGVTLNGNLQPSFTITGAPVDVKNYLKQPSNFLYTPAANVNGNGVLTLTVSCNDNNGFNAALATSTITVTAVNDAPTFTAGATLGAVLEDAANPAGDTITNLLGANFSDVDSGNTFTGIAVTADASTGSEGGWEYSTDGGANWFPIGSVSTSAGLLLDAATKLRFLPAADFDGTPGALTVYAVDSSAATTFTSGSTRQTFDTTADNATSKVSAAGVALGTSVTAVNDAPTLTATGQNPTYLEGGSAVTLFSAAVAAPHDSGQTFNQLVLTVTNVADGLNELVNIGGTDVALIDNNGGPIAGIGSYNVSAVSGTATVTAYNMTRNSAQMGTLVNGITYRDTKAAPSTTARVITLTSVKDSGGTSNGGVDTTTLSIASTVSIDPAPVVTGRTVPSNGTYIIGQDLDFTVTYSENVTVDTSGGTPYIGVTLNTGGTVQAALVSAIGSTLTFRYTVASGQLDADGLAVASSITLNGGTIKDGSAINAQTTSLGFGSTAGILIEGVRPTVVSSDRANANPTNATSVDYNVTFSESVSGVDTNDFTLTATGSAAGSVANVSPVTGSVYTVTVNTVSGDGTLRLDLKNTGTGIQDSVTNAIATGFTGGQTYTIDNTAPAVNSVAVPANATYQVSQPLDFTVNFDENVTVDTSGGTPRIALTIGSTTRYATYQSGSGGSALLFSYTIQLNDLDANGITVGTLQANGGTLRDAAGNNATLTLNSVGSTAAVLVDGTSPVVTDVSSTHADGTLKLGDTATITVTFSETVTVTGTPKLTLETGATDRTISYTGGSGSATLSFSYTVQAGDVSSDLDYTATTALALNGGTIKDASNNDAVLTLATPGAANSLGANKALVVDGVVPVVSSVNRQTPSGQATNATSVTFRVTFSEAVTGVDTADFALTRSAGTGNIASVTPVSTSVYDVVVNTLAGTGTARLDFTAASSGVADLAGNPIAADFTSGQNYDFDATAPTVSSIARNTPATVNTSGATATWRVTFGEAVTGVDVADFQLTLLSGSATGTIASVTPVSTSVYDVAVNSISGQGQLRLDLKASGTGIADLATNAISGGYTSGDFYQVGVSNVFDTLALTTGTVRTVANSTTNKVAQRFTTAAAQPLTVTTVMAALGTVSGTPVPVVTLNADSSGAPGSVVATLTNPGSLTSNTLATWTGSALLTASTTYWIVFADSSVSASYEIKETALTTGGAGAWLNSPADYFYKYGANLATGPQAGALQVALGATSTPSISSSLAASGTYGSSFSYQITATNLPSSYGATGLPAGLTLNSATGLISGTLGASGSLSVTLTATNGSGTGAPATLVITGGKPTITVTVDAKTKVYNTANPALTLSYSGFINGESASVLLTTPTLATDATTSSPVGTYAIQFTRGATATNYDFQYVPATLTVTKATQTITFPAPIIRLGSATALSATASSGLAVSLTIVSGPATLSDTILTPSGNGQVVVRASQAGNANYNAATNVEYTITVEGAPMPLLSNQNDTIISTGSSLILTQSTIIPNSTTQWQRNGNDLVGGTGSSIQLTNLQPSSGGLYSTTSTLAGGSVSVSDPVIVGLSTDQKVIGTGSEVGSNIIHPNGNTYDQVLLDGKGASLTADKSQVTRISFVDLSNDIVQVEFSGKGTLSVVMDDGSTPAPAANYNQPGVDYVRGHAGLVITGADETSNLNIFTVGKSTAVNQSLFKDGVNYDGVADIAYVAIQSTNGKFGGIRAGNVHFWATTGFTGVYAPGVTVGGPANIGNVEAFDSATPVLIFGSAGTVNITGGSLKQSNNQPVQVSGITQLKFVDGSTSGGTTLKAQANQAVLIENGVNVTSRIVVNP